ncbi:MAG: hypothetical protein QM662_02290 [Gordonia sp. (in: high G+C Gram-positive bacteria)]
MSDFPADITADPFPSDSPLSGAMPTMAGPGFDAAPISVDAAISVDAPPAQGIVAGEHDFDQQLGNQQLGDHGFGTDHVVLDDPYVHDWDYGLPDAVGTFPDTDGTSINLDPADLDPGQIDHTGTAGESITTTFEPAHIDLGSYYGDGPADGIVHWADDDDQSSVATGDPGDNTVIGNSGSGDSNNLMGNDAIADVLDDIIDIFG